MMQGVDRVWVGMQGVDRVWVGMQFGNIAVQMGVAR